MMLSSSTDIAQTPVAPVENTPDTQAKHVAAKDITDTTTNELKKPDKSDTVAMTFNAASWTSQGPRLKNEDYSRHGTLSDGKVYAIISDGIGGGPHGEIYSKIACNHTVKVLKSESFNGEIKDAIEATQDYCLEIMDDVEDCGGGATLLVALFSADGMIDCAYVGDSRLAIINSHGNFSWETAPNRKGGHVLASAIGIKNSEVLTAQVKIEPGSVALLMTDGAWEYLDGNTTSFTQFKSRAASGEKAFDLAFWLTNAAGHEGSDNATVVAVSANLSKTESCPVEQGNKDV